MQHRGFYNVLTLLNRGINWYFLKQGLAVGSKEYDFFSQTFYEWMDVNAPIVISLDWDIYLNEWRLSFIETSLEFDTLTQISEWTLYTWGWIYCWQVFGDKNFFWNFISK